MIRIENLTYSYDVRAVMCNVSMEIETGSVVAVMGPNGMGKSTLLGLMGGILPIQHGSIHIDGLLRRGSVEDELAIREKMYYLPYDAWLPPGIACENI